MDMSLLRLLRKLSSGWHMMINVSDIRKLQRLVLLEYGCEFLNVYIYITYFTKREVQNVFYTKWTIEHRSHLCSAKVSCPMVKNLVGKKKQLQVQNQDRSPSKPISEPYLYT